jgi:hypothetical protein
MIQIRRGCFETNSSSSHSLVLSNESNYIKRFDFKVKTDIYYGQNPFVLHSVQKKAEYVLVSLLDSINSNIH